MTALSGPSAPRAPITPCEGHVFTEAQVVRLCDLLVELLEDVYAVTPPARRDTLDILYWRCRTRLEAQLDAWDVAS
jgi:hypothetical protein